MGNFLGVISANKGISSIGVVVSLLVLLIAFTPRPKPKKNPKLYSPPPVAHLGVRIFNQIDYALRYYLGIRLVKPNTKELLKLASDVPSTSELFGNQDEIKVGISLFGEGLEKEPLTGFGMFANNRYRRIQLEKRSQVMNYILRNSSICDRPIRKPIIITGMMRTGSTLLFNLLNQDPNTRSPYLWEMAGANPNPTPPPTSPDDPRVKIVEKELSKLKVAFPEIFSKSAQSHFTSHDSIEECLFALTHQFFHQVTATMGGEKFIDWFLKSENKGYGYVYLKRFIQMLDSGYSPKSHWTLKAPIHSLYIEHLVKEFPDASIILTHRNPEEVVPSTCRLLEMTCYFNYPENSCDLETFGKYGLNMSKEMVDRVMKFRQTYKNHQTFFDCSYSELIKDPIAMVKNIYKHYGYEYTQEFEDRMKKYIQENPQGKHGRNKYSLQDYGLTKENLDDAFRDYLSNHHM